MKLLDEYQISGLAYRECLNGNDKPEIRSLITSEWYAYLYCLFVKNDSEVRKYITYENYLKNLIEK